jgi:hypothetical protein
VGLHSFKALTSGQFNKETMMLKFVDLDRYWRIVLMKGRLKIRLFSSPAVPYFRQYRCAFSPKEGFGHWPAVFHQQPSMLAQLPRISPTSLVTLSADEFVSQ